MEASLPQSILPIKLERSWEGLTSLGGLAVVEELARAVGLWEDVDRSLEGPKSGRGYKPQEFVQALVWMLHTGGRRLAGKLVRHARRRRRQKPREEERQERHCEG
jgi:hypothetical protein